MSTNDEKTFLGEPCRRMHHDEHGKCLRYKCNGACVKCTTENAARRRTALKQKATAGSPPATEATQ